MTEDNNMPEIGPKDELIDAIAELDDEGDRVIELKDEETGEKTKAIVESTFLFNGNNYVVLILDTDETDEDGEIIQDYVIMRFVDKGGDVLLESLVEKEEDGEELEEFLAVEDEDLLEKLIEVVQADFEADEAFDDEEGTKRGTKLTKLFSKTNGIPTQYDPMIVVHKKRWFSIRAGKEK